ncbi:hypothetical protein ECZU34_64350 [Escherichia coli]|nr:hypothetical protein ECZU34_64350 [Escherichia coli]
MKPNRPLIVILSTVALDAVGIGLIMPVLPGLLRDLVHSNDVTAHYGILLALYALMQFACAPVLGALSDRFGRRPVLLVSLAGAAVDYAIMATTPSFGFSISADRGRHHRGDWGGSRRLYCRYH